jgi:hypothetical protein
MSKVKSAIKTKSNYGFSRIDIDYGAASVYTCKLLMGVDVMVPVFMNNKINVIHLYITKKGVQIPMTEIAYRTMDYAEHRAMQREIGKFLHKHAIKQADKKYAYAYEAVDEAYGDMELTIPQPLNTLNWDDIDISSLPELH